MCPSRPLLQATRPPYHKKNEKKIYSCLFPMAESNLLNLTICIRPDPKKFLSRQTPNTQPHPGSLSTPHTN